MKRTYVVTGGTGGIGRHTAIALARTGATVVLTGQDARRGEQGVEAVKAASGQADIHLALGDLRSLSATRALAGELVARFPRIDALINNAGLLALERTLTVDGLEADFAVNVVAPYVLSHGLTAALRQAPDPRVINVTGGLPVGGLDPDNLQAEKGFVGLPTYSHAKRALEAMSLALAEELRALGIGVHVVFPGSASTGMTQRLDAGALPWWLRPLAPVFLWAMSDDGGRGAARASRSSVWASTSDSLAGATGQAFDSACRKMALHPTVLEPDRQARVMAAVHRAAGRPVSAG